MLRRTSRCFLRSLRSVKPNIVDPADAAFEQRARKQDRMDAVEQGGSSYSGQFASRTTEAPDTNALSGATRLGGAKVLLRTKLNFYQQTDDSNPFHYVRSSPRDAGLCGPLCRELQRMDIKSLTELQAALIPVMLKGRHIIAHAETGSGKSFGVALAVSNRILRDVAAHRLHTVILVPTAELALQYDKWIKHFAGSARHIVFAVSETLPLQEQLARLHNFRPHVLVGTPQAIASVMRHAVQIFGTKLRSQVDTIVLDEADVILRMPVSVSSIGDQRLPRHRRTNVPPSSDVLPGRGSKRLSKADLLLNCGADVVERLYRHEQDAIPEHIVALSATIDGPTARLLNSWMDNDNAMRLTSSLVEHSIPSSIDFYLFAASGADPAFTQEKVLGLVLRLIRLQHGDDSFRVLILTNEPVNGVTAVLDELNHAAGGSPTTAADVGGDPSQQPPFRYGVVSAMDEEAAAADPNGNDSLPVARAVGNTLRRGHRNIFAVNDSAVSRLTRGLDNVGIGTFSVARGLHVHGITHVIVYGEVPSTTDFVHCAGRTGRAGLSGDVCVIFPPRCGRQFQTTCHLIGMPWQTNKLNVLKEVVEAEEAKDADRIDRIATRAREDASLPSDGNARADMASTRLHQLRASHESYYEEELRGPPGHVDENEGLWPVLSSPPPLVAAAMATPIEPTSAPPLPPSKPIAGVAKAPVKAVLTPDDLFAEL